MLIKNIFTLPIRFESSLNRILDKFIYWKSSMVVESEIGSGKIHHDTNDFILEEMTMIHGTKVVP